MPIIAFGFEKISAERKKAFDPDKDKIENTIKFRSIEESNFKISGEDKKAITVIFEFTVDYKDTGVLELVGHIGFFDKKEVLDKILEQWKKEEKVPTDFGASLYNFIFSKANVKALALEEEVGLPLHLRLPRIKVKKPENTETS